MSDRVDALIESCRKANPNHHLWNNNGTWWFHCTVHLPNYTKERIRKSLATGDLETAQRRRDEELRSLATRGDLRLSIRSGRPSRASLARGEVRAQAA